MRPRNLLPELRDPDRVGAWLAVPSTTSSRDDMPPSYLARRCPRASCAGGAGPRRHFGHGGGGLRYGEERGENRSAATAERDAPARATTASIGPRHPRAAL